MISFVLFSTNPSFGFLWAVVVETFSVFRLTELDKVFDSIIRDVEEEVKEDNEYVSVAVVDDKAYWVVDNAFYEAELIDGEIDKTTSKPINAFDMSKKDIHKMLYILDNLDEG